jgi:hypothetical protein
MATDRGLWPVEQLDLEGGIPREEFDAHLQRSRHLPRSRGSPTILPIHKNPGGVGGIILWGHGVAERTAAVGIVDASSNAAPTSPPSSAGG